MITGKLNVLGIIQSLDDEEIIEIYNYIREVVIKNEMIKRSKMMFSETNKKTRY